MADRPANDRDRPKRPSSEHRPVRPAAGPEAAGRAWARRTVVGRGWAGLRPPPPRRPPPRRARAMTARVRIDGPAAATSATAATARIAARRIDRCRGASGPEHPGPAVPTATTDRAGRIRPAPAIARPDRARAAAIDRPTRADRQVRLARRTGRDPTSSRATTSASARPSTTGRVATSSDRPPYRPVARPRVRARDRRSGHGPDAGYGQPFRAPSRPARAATAGRPDRRRGARRRAPAGRGGVRRPPSRPPAARRPAASAGPREDRPACHEPADPDRRGRGRVADRAVPASMATRASPWSSSRADSPPSTTSSPEPPSAASRRSSSSSIRSRIRTTWVRSCGAPRAPASMASSSRCAARRP